MKTPLALILVCMFTASVYALPDYEPFADATASGGTSYTVGAALLGQTDAGGQTWVQNGALTGPQPTILSGSLSYTGLPTSQGNSVSFAGGSGAAGGDRLPLSAAVTSGTVYYSFLMDVTSLGTLPTSGVFWAGFNNTSGSSAALATSVGARLYARSATGGFQLGVQQNGGTTLWDSTDTFTTGTTLFIVGSYTFVSGVNQDTASLWIDPTIGPATPPSATLSGAVGTDLPTGQVASFVLMDRISTEPTGVFDELRIGTSWADVTAVPEPATATLAGLGLLGLIGFYRRGRR